MERSPADVLAAEAAPVPVPPPDGGLPALVRLRPRAGATPVGAILGGIGLVGTLAVGLLGLDRLGLRLCTLKAVTGIPCPTCGGTRVLGELAHLDLAGALALNPLVTLGVLGVLVWALVDLALVWRGRALALETSARGAWLLGAGAGVALFVNWIYLLVSGR